MRSWFWIGIVWAVLALAGPSPAVAGPILALDPPHSKEGEKEKIAGVQKGLFKGAVEVSLWTILVFVLLLTVLRKYAWGPIRDGLDKRERSIAHDKEEAVKAKHEADELRKQLQAEMARVNDQIRTMMDKARTDAQQTSAEELARGKAALAEERDRLRRELQISTDDALSRIWASSAQLATLISTKVIHKQLTYDDHRALVDEALGEFRQSLQGRKEQIESARMSEPQLQVRHRTVMDDESRHVARVYAEALYKAAEPANEVQPVLEELQTLVGGVFKQDPGLELFFASAAISSDRKTEVLRKTFEGRTTQTFYRFLNVLNDHERLDMLRAIEEAYRNLHNRRTRRVDVHVESAVPLTDDERRRLCDDVRAVAHIEPLLHEKVDPDILGGLIIRIQDWVYDASVRTRLQSVRDQLIERSDHGIQSGRDRFGS